MYLIDIFCKEFDERGRHKCLPIFITKTIKKQGFDD